MSSFFEVSKSRLTLREDEYSFLVSVLGLALLAGRYDIHGAVRLVA